MRILDTPLPGVRLIEIERMSDERGSFARSFCVDEFRDAGIEFEVHQASISFNRIAGTVRGMHLQTSPSPEAKIVRCTRGALFDVALDLRHGSETYCEWFATELNPESGAALLIPPGCAHGFQTLADETEVHYLMCGRFDAQRATGVRYDDPAFAIDWPLPVSSVSDKDRAWPDFDQRTGLKAGEQP